MSMTQIFKALKDARENSGAHLGVLRKTLYYTIIIHQIFSLARDWSQRVKWLNMPSENWGISPIFKTVRVSKKNEE